MVTLRELSSSTGRTLPTGPDPLLRLETVRQLLPAIEGGLNAVVQAAHEVDGVSPFGEHKWLRLRRGDDRSAALLLWRGDELVGAAHCDIYHTPAPDRPCRLTAEMVVHPKHRRRGLGTLLLRGLVALGREEYADEIHLWSYGNLAAARQIALDTGFRQERVLWQMHLPGEQLPPAPPLVPGTRSRQFVPSQDAHEWLSLHNRVFAGHPDQEDWEPGDLQARLEQPWFDPRDLLLLEDTASSTLLGFCWVKLRVDPRAPGEIYILGVDPATRGRGLGEWLTRAGLAHIRDAGRPDAMLYVEGSNGPAIRLYQRLGFTRRWEHMCYVRSLPALP